MAEYAANFKDAEDIGGMDAVIHAYRRDIDRTLLRENLKLTPEQRVRRLSAFLRFVEELQRAGRRLRVTSDSRRFAMSPEQARTIGRKFFEEQDRLRGGPAPELCAPGYQARIAGNPMDLAGHQQFATMFYGAFPDLSHTIEDVVADDRGAAVRFTLRGTHRGDFMGLPATGKSIDVAGIAILRLTEGKVSELWGEFDQMGMMRQLGALPAPV